MVLRHKSSTYSWRTNSNKYPERMFFQNPKKSWLRHLVETGFRSCDKSMHNKLWSGDMYWVGRQSFRMKHGGFGWALPRFQTMGREGLGKGQKPSTWSMGMGAKCVHVNAACAFDCARRFLLLVPPSNKLAMRRMRVVDVGCDVSSSCT